MQITDDQTRTTVRTTARTTARTTVRTTARTTEGQLQFWSKQREDIEDLEYHSELLEQKRSSMTKMAGSGQRRRNKMVEINLD